MVNMRGGTIDIPWESEFHIADVRTLTAYTFGNDDDAPLPMTRAEAE